MCSSYAERQEIISDVLAFLDDDSVESQHAIVVFEVFESQFQPQKLGLRREGHISAIS